MPEIDLIKAPPQDLAAEQAVLGAVFLDSERLVEIKEFLSSDDFYKNAHKIIFRTMEKRDVPIERLDVAAFLGRILQRNVEDDRVDADVAEREVLRRRRLLHEEVA